MHRSDFIRSCQCCFSENANVFLVYRSLTYKFIQSCPYILPLQHLNLLKLLKTEMRRAFLNHRKQIYVKSYKDFGKMNILWILYKVICKFYMAIPVPLSWNLSWWIDFNTQARCFLNFKSKCLWDSVVKFKSINNLWRIAVISESASNLSSRTVLMAAGALATLLYGANVLYACVNVHALVNVKVW